MYNIFEPNHSQLMKNLYLLSDTSTGGVYSEYDGLVKRLLPNLFIADRELEQAIKDDKTCAALFPVKARESRVENYFAQLLVDAQSRSYKFDRETVVYFLPDETEILLREYYMQHTDFHPQIKKHLPTDLISFGTNLREPNEILCQAFLNNDYSVDLQTLSGDDRCLLHDHKIKHKECLLN